MAPVAASGNQQIPVGGLVLCQRGRHCQAVMSLILTLFHDSRRPSVM